MELKLANSEEAVTVSEAVFGRAFNETLVHQIVTAHLAGARKGSKAQKTRAEVSGGGKKPWRQKGTGRARAGTIRSPIWTGGGKTFAASPRDFGQKVNKKMYRAGISAIFSELLRQDRLKCISNFSLESRSTKGLIATLGEQGCKPEGLLVTDSVDDKLGYSANNLALLNVVAVRDLDPVSLVGAEQVLITESAVQAVEGWLS